MPDHEHGKGGDLELDRYADRVDHLELIEHLEGPHGWLVPGEATIGQLKRKHWLRHHPGMEQDVEGL
jgi:hypothetical protein